MIHLSYSKHCRQSIRLLFTVCVSCALLTGAGNVQQVDEPRSARERYIELDGEIQAIKEEILGINRDIMLLEELTLYPHGQQLIVLVSVASNSPVNPGSILLQLDGNTVSQYSYTDSEAAALQKGGVHRIYTGRLKDGEHMLKVSVTGIQTRDRPFSEQHSVTITKRPGRKYMELHLGLEEGTAQPGLTIREW